MLSRYHVILKWGYNFYDNWLYAAMAVWGFDRLFRLGRILKNGVKRASVTEIGNDHVRVDIPGIRWANSPGSVAFTYFPTINPFRPWENHPFSVNSTGSFHHYGNVALSSSTSSSPSSLHGSDPEKANHRVAVSPSASFSNPAGLTLIIKKSAGLTSLLRTDNRLLTLIDGPYSTKTSASVLQADQLLLVGGGIGITGLVAWARVHPNIKLAWSVKNEHEPLIRELDPMLSAIADKQVSVGERIDIDRLIRQAAESGYEKIGVVVCGPPAMCDEVRDKVARVGRGSKTVFELEVDAFSW